MMSQFDYIKRNLDNLNEEIARISNRCGRTSPRLVCVTKSASDDELLALAAYASETGIFEIGENRPGELQRRGELLLNSGFSPLLHQIGTLQSNKAKLVAPIASLIHSLSSESLAKELSRQADKLNKKIPVLIEVNSAKEPNKDGVFPEDTEAFLLSIEKYPKLEIKGLMTMGPADIPISELRKYFTLTKKLFDDLKSRYGFSEDAVLSMGMSDSYEAAIEEGSDIIRVGRKLFIK